MGGCPSRNWVVPPAVAWRNPHLHRNCASSQREIEGVRSRPMRLSTQLFYKVHRRMCEALTLFRDALRDLACLHICRKDAYHTFLWVHHQQIYRFSRDGLLHWLRVWCPEGIFRVPVHRKKGVRHPYLYHIRGSVKFSTESLSQMAGNE